jgi:formylglycine-generating enzyme required for sulfatase activity
MLPGNVPLELIVIPGGEFTMGGDRFDNEKPPHRVGVSPFAIGKYQVTQAQWKAVMGNNPSKFQGDALPVERVSWEEAKAFCEKLSEMTGNEYRLPTEAEWEYAARAGSTGEYCFGDDERLLGDYAWYRENSDKKTHPVGQKTPNAFGLYDMHGNVWEWCSDWYGEDYYKELEKGGVAIDPRGPSAGSYRVNRGGGWDDIAVICRSAYRISDAPGFRYDDLGFRLVRVGRNP